MSDATFVGMRSFVLFCMFATTATADPDVPDACADLAKLAASPSPNQALSAKIALAGCVADQKLKPLVLCDCEQSVQEVDAAAQPSLVILDEVFASGDA